MDRTNSSSLTRALLLVTVVWSASIAACDAGTSSASERAASQPKSGLPSFEGVKIGAQETLESAQKVLAEKQAEFKQTSESKLSELESKLGELEQQVARAGERAKPELEQLVHELEEKRAQAATKLAEWKSTGHGAWHSFTTQVDQTLTDLDQQIEKALSNSK